MHNNKTYCESLTVQPSGGFQEDAESSGWSTLGAFDEVLLSENPPEAADEPQNPSSEVRRSQKNLSFFDHKIRTDSDWTQCDFINIHLL